MFRGTIALQYFRSTMLPDPSPTLRLFSLTKVFMAHSLREAIHPFHIIVIYTNTFTTDHKGKEHAPELIFNLALDREWCDEKQTVKHASREESFKAHLACNQTASWQNVWTCPGRLSPRVKLGGVNARDIRWPAGRCLTLSDVIKECMSEVEKCSRWSYFDLYRFCRK